MHGEHDWYLSLMSLEDKIAARKHIPGIPSDTRNPGLLEKMILDAFNRAYRPVARGGTKARISIRDFYSKCAEDYLKRNKQALNESFEAFILTIGLSRVRPYTKVALFSYGYPDKFENYLPQMMANKEEGKSLFDGIENRDLTDVDKIAIMLEYKPVTRFTERMQEIEEFALERYRDEWGKIEQFVKDAGESELYNQLSKWTGDLQWLGVFSFLKNLERYKSPEYKKLLNVVLQKFADIMLVNKNHQNQNDQHKNQQLDEEKKRLLAEYGQISQEVDSLQKELEGTTYQLQLAQEQIARISTELSISKMENDDYKIKGRLYDQFVNLLKEKYKTTMFTFLSDNNSLFPALFCGSKIVENLNDLTTNMIVFIDRPAFPSSTIYFDILQELDTRGIQYVELLGYDELDQLRQVMEY